MGDDMRKHSKILVKSVRVNGSCHVCGKPVVKGDDTMWQRNEQWRVWHRSCDTLERCERCGSLKPNDQSCDCFDNNCE